MKKVISILTFIFILLVNTNAQNIEVPNTQVPVIVKVTASWCPFCGTWGWDFFENLYEDNYQKSIIFAAHYSGDFKNNVSIDIAKNFNASGQPIFYLDGIDQNVSSGNSQNKRNSFSTQINNKIQESPLAQTGIKATYNNNKLYVDYSTKFYQSVSGEYYIGIYLIEKLVIGFQASRGQNAQHKNILRKELSGNSFGNLLAKGTVAENMIYKGHIEVDLDDYKPQNLEIATIIWKKEGARYFVVNSNIDNEVSEENTSGIQDNFISKNSISIYPTVINKTGIIKLFSQNNIPDTKVDLYNINGKKVINIYSGKIEKGENIFKIKASDYLLPSIYYIVIDSKNNTLIAQKIIIK